MDQELYDIIEKVYSRWSGSEVAAAVIEWRRRRDQAQQLEQELILLNELKDKYETDH
jgi:hypothetical protein